jgi:hypothetical protein
MTVIKTADFKILTLFFLKGLKDLRELATLIDSSSGISVSCDLDVSSDSVVPYVITNFRILGELPPHLSHLDYRPARNSVEEPVSEKEARFRRLVQLYKVGSLSWKNTSSSDTILSRYKELKMFSYQLLAVTTLRIPKLKEPD